MAKIAIIDDTRPWADAMEFVAMQAGHETLCIIVLPSRNFKMIADEANAFGPDVVFLDHSLGYWPLNGANIAGLLRVGKEQIVGTSTCVEHVLAQKKYCGRAFTHKNRILEHPEHAQEFLKLCQPQPQA
ncbi:MAG: hypothetical protein JNN11_04730 [Candidatus Doudnabacteria bacterium]|nr:hypothetical protein [Candidatus Doudnabacteria bacterium]